MSPFVISIFILLIVSDFAAVKNLDQAGAVMTFCDPAYIINCKAITRRVARNSPYLTNITATTLHPFNNNVTISISYNPEKYSDTFIINIKACEIVKAKWLKAYLIKFSNIPIECPIAPGGYELLNMEFPPKGFPLPLPKEDTNLRLTMLLTDNKHIISQCDLTLRS